MREDLLCIANVVCDHGVELEELGCIFLHLLLIAGILGDKSGQQMICAWGHA